MREVPEADDTTRQAVGNINGHQVQPTHVT